MGVGLYLTGEYHSKARTAEHWLKRAAAWIEEHGGEPFPRTDLDTDEEDRPTLIVHLHPAGEGVEITVPEPGSLIVSAKTSTVGPGYHCHVCDLLHRFGEEYGITWDPPAEDGDTGDETGYFHTGDAASVEAAMLSWLQSVAGIVLENLDGGQMQSLMLSLPMGRHYEHNGPIVTPLGPRTREWFEAVAEEPRGGIDFFPWWEPGLNAGFHLGRALHRLWIDVRWRPPLTDAEETYYEETLTDLFTAYSLDPSRSYPWLEWQELLEYTGWTPEYIGFEESDFDTVRKHARQEDESRPRIGYRRHPVRVDLSSGWSLEIPGAMAEEWEAGTWSAWDDERTVWFTAFHRTNEDDSPVPAKEALADATGLEDGEQLEWRADALIGRAVFLPFEDDGNRLWNLKAFSAIDGGLALCNIYLRNPADRGWAVGVWHSLRNRGSDPVA